MATTTAAAQEPPPQCRLIKLPGELRNRIYREVLVEPKHQSVTITSSGYDRPGLLNTCKQIRAEALSIYLGENSFQTTITAFDSEPLARLNQSLSGVKFNAMFKLYTMTEFRQPSWDNLVVWLRRWHAKEVQGSVASPAALAESPSTLVNQMTVGNMFFVVEKLRGMSWRQAEEIVMGMRPLLVKVDGRWAEK